MKIESIEILNYKSIKELIVPVAATANEKTGCTNVLVGINESGKSSILEAMHKVSTGFKNEVFDKICNKDNQDDCKYVDVYAYFSDLPHTTIANHIVKQIPTLKPLINKIKSKSYNKNVYLNEDNTPSTSHNLQLTYSSDFPWHTLVLYPVESNGKKFYRIGTLKDINKVTDIITKDNYKDYILSGQSAVSDSVLTSHIVSHLTSFLNSMVPSIELWRPKSEYLINEPIDLEKFAEDTGISIPLRNIFGVYGKKDEDAIKNTIERALKSTEKKAELEAGLSKAISKHLNNVWKEHKVQINIRIEGTQCNVFVEDKTNKLKFYDMEQRSDGFKQFVSLILSLSTLNESNQLKNRIILLDEPDTHLHPSGIRYMRDELKKIGKNNFVFLATHSHYMIDTENPERNWVVTKEKNQTCLSQCSDNDLYDDAVLQDAFGISLMKELIPNIVILTEGDDDKRIIEYLLSTQKLDTNYIVFSGEGSKTPTYAGIFLQRDLNLFVVVDDDSEGKGYKKKIARKTFKEVYTLKDLVKTSPAQCTLEDLFDEDFLISTAKKEGYIIDDYDRKKPFIEQLKAQNENLRGGGNKEKLLKFKDDLSIKLVTDCKKTGKPHDRLDKLAKQLKSKLPSG